MARPSCATTMPTSPRWTRCTSQPRGRSRALAGCGHPRSARRFRPRVAVCGSPASRCRTSSAWWVRRCLPKPTGIANSTSGWMPGVRGARTATSWCHTCGRQCSRLPVAGRRQPFLTELREGLLDFGLKSHSDETRRIVRPVKATIATRHHDESRCPFRYSRETAHLRIWRSCPRDRRMVSMMTCLYGRRGEITPPKPTSNPRTG